MIASLLACVKVKVKLWIEGINGLTVNRAYFKRIVEDLIHNIVKIDDMQFGFMPGRGTTDAIFIVRQIQEAYIGKKIGICNLLSLA